MADKSEFRRAFSEMMNEFGPGIYRYALSLTGNEELANDIYQQTFLLLLEKKPEIHSPRTAQCVADALRTQDSSRRAQTCG